MKLLQIILEDCWGCPMHDAEKAARECKHPNFPKDKIVYGDLSPDCPLDDVEIEEEEVEAIQEEK